MKWSIKSYQATPGSSKVPLPSKTGTGRVTTNPNIQTRVSNPSTAKSSSPLPGVIRRSAAALPSKSSPAASSVLSSSSSSSSSTTSIPSEAKLQSSKTLVDSYKSLSPNTRIAFGVVLGIVGIAGLYWDRWAAPEESRQGDKPLVAMTVVDREK